MATAPTVLVVSATAAEAAHVPEGLPLVITGIGKTAAAARTARALTELDDVAELVVVNIGTAGALRDGLTGLFEVATVVNHDMNAEAILALGYDPQAELALTEHGGEEPIVLATGDLFVDDAEIRDALGEDAHLVDMEGYAVAWTARDFGRDVVLVKYVSDNADESARDWADAVEASAVALGAWLSEFVANGARPVR